MWNLEHFLSMRTIYALKGKNKKPGDEIDFDEALFFSFLCTLSKQNKAKQQAMYPWTRS